MTLLRPNAFGELALDLTIIREEAIEEHERKRYEKEEREFNQWVDSQPRLPEHDDD